MPLDIQRIPISDITPASYNPRKDLQPGDPEFEKLRKSIETFDCVEPLIWNSRTGNLVGGHQRLKVLIARGDSEVEVSVVDLDENQEKALNVALNRISGDWQLDKLAGLLSDLEIELPDLGITGFDSEQLLSLRQDYSIPDIDDFFQGEEKVTAEKKCPHCGGIL